MATRAWDQVPVYGWWQSQPGVALPEGSRVRFTIVGTDRVRRVDGRMIYPGGIIREVTIGKPEDQDDTVKARIHDAMRAAAEAAQGAEFDSVAWEAEWSAALPHAIFTSFYATDDTDVTPQGWQVKVSEHIPGAGGGKEYMIEPVVAQIDPAEGIPGINLAAMDPPPGSPTVPAPVYAKGQPNGIAPLGVDAKVPLEYLPDDIGGGGVPLTEYQTQVASLPDYPEVFPPDTSGLAQVATTGAYTDLTGRPSIPTTAADVGAVPTTRTVNGKPLSSNVTLDASDVSAVPTTRTVAGKPLSADVTLTAGDVGAVPTTRTVAGKALSSNVTLTPSDVGVSTSSTSTAGLVELATTAEATTGTDTQRAVTPAGLKAGLDARIGGGLVFLGAGPTPPDPSGLPDNHVWLLTGE